jgi:hypothetical protein
MAGHSPSKTGVKRPYVPAIHAFLPSGRKQDVDARDKRGHDENTGVVQSDRDMLLVLGF